jgi:hypothetical protein
MPEDRFVGAEEVLNDAPPEEDTFGETEQQTVARLAALDDTYDRLRESEAAPLGVRVGSLDKKVKKARARVEADENDAEDWTPPDPLVEFRGRRHSRRNTRRVSTARLAWAGWKSTTAERS